MDGWMDGWMNWMDDLQFNQDNGWVKKKGCVPELQIIGGTEDNSKLIFLISQ